MGKSVIAENSIQSHVEKFFGSEKWHIGLIIGQQTAQKDYALHLIRTPKPDPGDIAADDDDDDDGPIPRGPDTRKPDSIDKVDEHYVATHAKQVQRMLPGGLDVIGIFAVAPPDMMKDAQVKLRQFLYAVHKSLRKGTSMIPRHEDDITDKIVLQICSVTRKITCRSFDAADPKCASRPGDWKYQSFAASWLCLHTTVSLDIVIPVAMNNIAVSLMKQIQNGVRPVCDNIWNSLSTINGQLPTDENDLLDSSQQGRKKRGRTEDSSSSIYEVQLFTPCKYQNTYPDPEISECGAKMQLRGRMSCRAYVHNKASIQLSLQALKTDVIRSLLFRCELMYEEIKQTEEDQDPKVLYETPRRVFGQLPGTDICLCDYMFPDESVTDCTERIKDLADLELDEDLLQTNEENLPNDDDLMKPAQSLEEENLDVQDSKEKSNNSNFYSVVFGGIVAVIAAISYMLIGQEP